MISPCLAPALDTAHLLTAPGGQIAGALRSTPCARQILPLPAQQCGENRGNRS